MLCKYLIFDDSSISVIIAIHLYGGLVAQAHVANILTTLVLRDQPGELVTTQAIETLNMTSLGSDIF